MMCMYMALAASRFRSRSRSESLGFRLRVSCLWQKCSPSSLRTPHLMGWNALDDSGNVRRSHNNGRCLVLVPGPDYLMSRSSGESVHTLKGATAYRGTTVILPRTGASAEPLRPLMSWWLMLYALSMLARYSPGNWTRTLSISESPIASRIEFILDTAIDAVPELLWDELFSSTKE